MTNDQTADTSRPATEARSTIGSVASDIKAATTQKFDEAVTEMRARADATKLDVADEVGEVATALRRASGDLRTGSPQERALGKVADGLADASGSIRDKDLGEILQMVSRIGRENPVLFLGGAALLGFAASRFARATDNHRGTAQERDLETRKEQVNAFVGEGNPNTQPMPSAP